MDRMEASKFIKDNKQAKNTLSTVPKRAPKPIPSIKVSLPITHYLNDIQKYKNSNVRMKTPSPNQTETRPQQFGLPPTTPRLLSPSSLRKFRHPVPTSKGSEPILHTAIPQTKINTPPIEERVKNKAEFVAQKSSYGITVNKENLRATNNTQTVYRSTQTEKVCFISVEDFKILETIKNSGLTSQDLQNQIDNLKKQMDKNNDNDCSVIDLDSTEENNSSNDLLDTARKYSHNNKKQILLTAKNHQLSVPAAVPPPERTAATSEQQPHLAGPVTPAESLVKNANFKNALFYFKILQDLQTNNALELPLHFTPRTDSQTTQTETITEDEDNSKKRKRHAQEVPVMIPQQQEVPMFQPHVVTPHQVRQMQIQQFVPEHVERTTQLFPSNLTGLIPHHRNQFPMKRNHTQYPFQHVTPQIQVQMPPQVQLPSAPGLHPRDPRSHTMQSQLRLPHMSRVLSTQEANLHGQAAQHHEYNWYYEQDFHRHGNVFPQRHQ